MLCQFLQALGNCIGIVHGFGDLSLSGKVYVLEKKSKSRHCKRYEAISWHASIRYHVGANNDLPSGIWTLFVGAGL